jgi:hypothetical protein
MLSGRATSKEQQVRMRLNELVRTLEQIEAVISVSTAALRHQNCEKDADVARVLQRAVGDRLSVEIEKTGALLAALKPGARATSKRPRK